MSSGVFESTRLEIEAPMPSWQRSQGLGTDASRWNGYLNRLCLHTILDWLRQDYDARAAALPNAAALDSFWELVNGTAIALAGRRLILIPSEAIDADELRVPQEWVDIPSWAGDYYGAVQVDIDEGWMQLNGFATHRQLRQGRYEESDRTYCLEDSDLIADFGVLWVSQQLAPQEITRALIQDLATLQTTQAENLIDRLGNPAVVNPRLVIPFEQWGALVQHGGWRQRLAERRQGLPEQRSLIQWLRSGVSTLAQQAGWGQVEFQPSVAGARGEATSGGIALTRQLNIAELPYELMVAPMTIEANTWRFTLRSLTTGGSIPAGFVLRLLTEDLQPFEGNEDRAEAAIDALFIEVALEPNEGLVWEVEPTPEGYDREILNLTGLP